MSYHIIGIAGPAHSGKDTLADYIITKLPYQKMSFADPMKRMLQRGLGLTRSQLWGDEKEIIDSRYGCTPRHMLQTIGTEWGRNLVSDGIWVSALDALLSARKQYRETKFIVPDVRFENEAAFVREHGTLIHIQGRDQGVGKGHVSEEGIAHKSDDLLIDNDDLIETFYEYIDDLIQQITEA